jgi:hypothetical protein
MTNSTVPPSTILLVPMTTKLFIQTVVFTSRDAQHDVSLPTDLSDARSNILVPSVRSPNRPGVPSHRLRTANVMHHIIVVYGCQSTEGLFGLLQKSCIMFGLYETISSTTTHKNIVGIVRHKMHHCLISENNITAIYGQTR